MVVGRVTGLKILSLQCKMGRERRHIKPERERGRRVAVKQPVVRNEMNLCEAESCLLSSGFFWVLHTHQGFIIVFQCLFLLQLLYQYISVAHTLQRTSESLAGLLKDSWIPLTASDSVGT